MTKQYGTLWIKKNQFWLVTSQDQSGYINNIPRINKERMKERKKTTYKHGELSHTNLVAPLLTTYGCLPPSMFKLNTLISKIKFKHL